MPQVSEEELRAEITRFATYLYATQLQRDRVTGGESARDTSAEEALRAAAGVGLDEALPLPQAFAHFFRTAADFVTPGDLYKTQSLASLGELSPAP